MVSLQAFEVDITQSHALLTYDLGEAFFGLFENSLLEKGNLTTTVKVKSKPGNVQLLFIIVGAAELVCDRSLEVFNDPIHIEKEVNFKLGHENKELAAELYLLEYRTTTINIAQHIYDFVSLEVPMKKLHPRFLNNDAS
jgi:uncharacterized metal-binding protein YceD (DUF177 family)